MQAEKDEVPPQTAGDGVTFHGPVSWNVIWAVLCFLAGALFTMGMEWGRNTIFMNNLAVSLTHLEGEVRTLTDKYVDTDKTVANKLQQMEDHLEYNDDRLNKVEQETEAISKAEQQRER